MVILVRQLLTSRGTVGILWNLLDAPKCYWIKHHIFCTASGSTFTPVSCLLPSHHALCVCIDRLLPLLAVCFIAESQYADRVHSVWFGIELKLTAVEVYKRSSIKVEITGRQSQTREHTLLYWVAELIQQQTDPEQDHLSPLWSPYKSSTFPPLLLCCPQAHKASFSMLLLAKGVRETSSEVYCGWSMGVWTNAYRHTHRILFSFDETDHKTAILTRMIHVQPLLTAE